MSDLSEEKRENVNIKHFHIQKNLDWKDSLEALHRSALPGRLLGLGRKRPKAVLLSAGSFAVHSEVLPSRANRVGLANALKQTAHDVPPFVW